MSNLDQKAAEARAAIEQLVAKGNLDEANKQGFNLAADLAECWPGDEAPREIHHLELGREMAERCLEWRHQLKRGPRPFAIAHWVHGLHLLSLARRTGERATLAAAVAAFERSVTTAVAAAAASGGVDRVEPDGDYLVIINSGFLGVARELAVPGTGLPLLERATDCFRAQAERFPARAEEANYGLANLRAARERFLQN